MTAKDLIKILKDTINELKEANIKSIAVSNFDTFINTLEKSVDDGSEYRKEIEIPKYLEELKGYEAQRVEALRAVYTYGAAALKSAILINGAASIALLAFLGNAHGDQKFQGLSVSLLIFVGGTLSAAVATGLTYISQANYAGDIIKTGNCYRIGAVVCVLLSYILFALGASLATVIL